MLGFLLEPVGVFCVIMIVIMVPMLLWKLLVGTINVISPPPGPQNVPFTEQVAADLNELLSKEYGAIQVWNREKRHPDHPDWKWVEVPRDPEDPIYEWEKTQKRRVDYVASEFRKLGKAFSIELSGGDGLTVYLGRGRKKYAFFYCGLAMWRCEFRFDFATLNWPLSMA